MNTITIDTIDVWVATRINGASASMVVNSPIDLALLKELDKKIRPYVRWHDILKKYIKGIWDYEGTDFTTVLELTPEEIEFVKNL